MTRLSKRQKRDLARSTGHAPSEMVKMDLAPEVAGGRELAEFTAGTGPDDEVPSLPDVSVEERARWFLQELPACLGNISKAAARAGISRKVLYDLRAKNPSFAEAWRRTLEGMAAEIFELAMAAAQPRMAYVLDPDGNRIPRRDTDGKVIYTDDFDPDWVTTYVEPDASVVRKLVDLTYAKTLQRSSVHVTHDRDQGDPFVEAETARSVVAGLTKSERDLLKLVIEWHSSDSTGRLDELDDLAARLRSEA